MIYKAAKARNIELIYVGSNSSVNKEKKAYIHRNKITSICDEAIRQDSKPVQMDESEMPNR